MVIISFLLPEFPYWSVGFKPITASPTSLTWKVTCQGEKNPIQSICEHGNRRQTYLNLRHADGKETRQKQQTMEDNEKGKIGTSLRWIKLTYMKNTG